jgi:cytochrome c biogenesis factor
MAITPQKNTGFFAVFFSLKTASVGMLLLAILTVWGTLYELRYGLYAGQERFFHSWLLFLGDTIPFPGVRLVVAFLFVQCAAAVARRFRLDWQEAGFLIIHAGILVLFTGMAIISFFAEEATLTLAQGETSGVAETQDKDMPLPVRITLLEFQKKDYAGTTTAKSYESRVRLEATGVRREALISMNRPLRYGSFTFYQYSFDQSGDSYTSTFAVVKNPVRNLPYAAGVMIAIGFLLHFIVKLIFAMMGARRAEKVR